MTDIVDIPAALPISRFPRVDEEEAPYNQAAYEFGASLPPAVERAREIVEAGRTNSLAAKEQASSALQHSRAAENARDAAQLAATNAAGSAAFYGPWSALDGALEMPATVVHKGRDWRLLRNLPTVAAAEPGASDAWQDASPVRTPTLWAQFASTDSFVVPLGVASVRGYALGKGADGTTASSGGGGSMGYGDIPVAAGDVLQIEIVAGVCVIKKNGTAMLTGNPAVGVVGGVATPNHADVLNGGSYAGGSGSAGAKSGGGAAGSPLGLGGAGSSAGGGGAMGNAAVNANGASASKRDTVRRSLWERYTDPLLAEANGIPWSSINSSGSLIAMPGEPGAGGTAGSTPGNGGFGSGGGAKSNASSSRAGGAGGFGGGGGASENGAGGAGGEGGGGGAGTTAGGSGGPATALLHY